MEIIIHPHHIDILNIGISAKAAIQCYKTQTCSDMEIVLKYGI